MWGTYCFCEASRDELGSNSRKFWLGWVPAAHHPSQPVLHICESCLNTRSSILESRGHPLPLQSEGLPRAILPFSWGRARCPGCAGARGIASWDTACSGHRSCSWLCSLTFLLSTNAHKLGSLMHYGEQLDQPSLPSSPPMVEQ